MQVVHKNINTPSALDVEREKIRQDLWPVFLEIDKYDVEKEKIPAIFEYVLMLRGKFKQMSFPRIVNKVAEHFHLKKKGA